MFEEKFPRTRKILSFKIVNCAEIDQKKPKKLLKYMSGEFRYFASNL